MKSTENGALETIVGRSAGTTEPAVAACLTCQPLVPVCLKAIAKCSKPGSSALPRIAFDAEIEKPLKVWLDASLFTELLVDLLRYADDHAGDGGVSFSICYDGMNDCRLMIAYTPRSADGDGLPDFRSNRVGEIVSQHRVVMDVCRSGSQVVIQLQFRN